MAITSEPPFDNVSILFEARRQGRLHQAEPVTIEADLILRIDRSDAVLEINDCGQGGFKNDISHSGLVVAPDEMIAINVNFDMQAILAQKSDKRVGPGFSAAGKPARIPQVRFHAIIELCQERAAFDAIG